MPRPRNAKVWNEDLVRALQARADQQRIQGGRYHLLFNEAAQQIAQVRKDIYAFSNDRIVNLPDGLSKTASDTCRLIITGNKPIIPEGFIPTLPQDAIPGNPFQNYPYVKEIKLRGGAFAILMAFYCSQSSRMTKRQIIAAGQQFCDEAMEDNYLAGRPYGAFQGHVTLERHGLIRGNKPYYEFQARGTLRQVNNDAWFDITRNGELFIEALFD